MKAGQELKIPIPLKGWPVPTAVWELNGKEVEKGPRVKIEVPNQKSITVSYLRISKVFASGTRRSSYLQAGEGRKKQQE